MLTVTRLHNQKTSQTLWVSSRHVLPLAVSCINESWLTMIKQHVHTFPLRAIPEVGTLPV